MHDDGRLSADCARESQGMAVLERGDLIEPIRVGATGFESEHGAARTLCLLDEAAVDEAWAEKQSNASAEYRETHEEEKIAPEIRALYSLFEAYATRAITTQCGPDSRGEPPLVLDVGCGTAATLPPYARNLSRVVRYVGLDPFKVNLDREYPFICSTVEQLASVRDKIPAVDAFLFSTSLDHMQDLAAAASSVRAVAKRGALAVFWVGVHDVSIVSAAAGAHLFERVFSSRSTLRQAAQFYGWALLRFPRYVRGMARRAEALRTGQPLDNLHFHYFQAGDLDAAIRAFGDIEDKLLVPNSNSCFVTCRIR
jgi:SAM-dependent methyltransferase